MDPFYRLALPYGGIQARKTKGGIEASIDGIVRNRKGDVMFYDDNDLPIIIQRLLFGKYTTPKAREFFEERNK